MQNKGFVKVFAVLLTLVCLFYLSFTFVTSRNNEKMENWAAEQTASWVAERQDSNVVVSEDEKNEYYDLKRDEYLETIKDEKVWLGIYTLQQCRELEIGLGLDLKGGLSVTLEVSVPEFLKSLAGNAGDKDVEAAIAAAQNAALASEDPIAAFISSLPEGRTLAQPAH